MNPKHLLRVLACIVSIGLLLSACRRAQTPEPTSTARSTGTPMASATARPAKPVASVTSAGTSVAVVPSSAPPVQTQLSSQTSPTIIPGNEPGAYPAPGLPTPTSTTSSGTPYPPPDTPLPTSTTSSGTPYPAAPTLLLTPTTASGTPYPLPGSTPQSQAPTPAAGPGTPTPTLTQIGPTTYPGPGIPTQTKIPATGGSPTVVQAGPTAALTHTATPSVVRARIQATDPRSFQVISGQPQLVEFFTFDSPVSRSMAPVVHGLEDAYKNRIHFVYLDLDDPANSLYKSMLKGRLPPFFFLLDAQGALLKEWQGYVPLDAFETEFAALGG